MGNWEAIKAEREWLNTPYSQRGFFDEPLPRHIPIIDIEIPFGLKEPRDDEGLIRKCIQALKDRSSEENLSPLFREVVLSAVSDLERFFALSDEEILANLHDNAPEIPNNLAFRGFRRKHIDPPNKLAEHIKTSSDYVHSCLETYGIEYDPNNKRDINDGYYCMSIGQALYSAMYMHPYYGSIRMDYAYLIISTTEGMERRGDIVMKRNGTSFKDNIKSVLRIKINWHE